MNRSLFGLLAILAPLQAWALFARDTDFYLPEPFAGIAFAVVVAWAVTEALPTRWRTGLRLAVVVLPVTVVLGLEIHAYARDADIRGQRLQAHPDRLLRFAYRPGADTPDDVAVPGAVDRVQLRINEHGMWDLPRSRRRAPGTLRIALLGDSVPNDSFVPLEQRFHRLLEGKLTERLGVRVEVLNFAVEGYNTAQELRAFTGHVSAFDIDVVLWAYVLNDPFMQDGSYRRVGHSFFIHRIANGLQRIAGISDCALFEPLYGDQAFELVVRNSFQAMRLAAAERPVRVAVLPIVAPFADPACAMIYDRVAKAGTDAGLEARKVVDAFAGTRHTDFLKAGEESDVTHPNAAGHARIADFLARWLATDAAIRSALPGAATPTEGD